MVEQVVKYLCFFNDWSRFMYGILEVGDNYDEYDFVDVDHVDDPSENVLDPFTEEEARKHFANKGYPNVRFIYLYPGENLDNDI